MRCGANPLNRATRGYNSIGRVPAFHTGCCEFEPRYPLHRLMGIEAATSFFLFQNTQGVCRRKADFRTATKQIPQSLSLWGIIQRHRQVVRQGTLTPSCACSNQAVAASGQPPTGNVSLCIHGGGRPKKALTVERHYAGTILRCSAWANNDRRQVIVSGMLAWRQTLQMDASVCRYASVAQW